MSDFMQSSHLFAIMQTNQELQRAIINLHNPLIDSRDRESRLALERLCDQFRVRVGRLPGAVGRRRHGRSRRGRGRGRRKSLSQETN